MGGAGGAYVAGHFLFVDGHTYGFLVAGKYYPPRGMGVESDFCLAAYLCGTDNDYAQGIALDDSGNAYVTGYSASASWATVGAFNTNNQGNNDIFVAKVSADGTSLVYATFLGGSASDVGTG